MGGLGNAQTVEVSMRLSNTVQTSRPWRIHELTQDFLRPIFEQARTSGQLRDGIVSDDAAEFVLRMILSLLSVAGPRRRSQVKEREFLRTYCAGAIIRD